MLEVPLDYADPAGSTLELGVSRVASMSDERIGSVVVNPGGPGGPGTNFAPTVAAAWADNAGLARFDIVGIDQRGVGLSTPAMDCFSDEQRENDAITVGVPPGGLFWTKDSTRAIFQQCAESVGGEDVLEHFGTRNSVRDLDVLRATLGEEQLTFYGVSWGTRLGAVYAETFPQNVRALVLDGALDPRSSHVDRQTQLYTGLQRSVDQLSAYCIAQGDCPLGDDPAQATAELQTILQPLVQTPIPAADGRDLTFFKAVEGIILSLYDETVWPFAITGIAELQQGSPDTLLKLRDLYSGRTDSGSYANLADAGFAISCLDEEQLSGPDTTALVADITEMAPFLDPGVEVDTEYGCAGWPTGDALDFPYAVDIEGLPQTLVVSVTGDGLTPHEGGIALAETLGARLLTVEGEQHGVGTAGNPCVDEILADYLTELRLPAEEATCTM